jgi:sec-independent protein translocase protein TatC
MSSAIDDDTKRAVASGREAAGTMLRSVQKHLQKVFIVFVIGLVGTIMVLRRWVWDILRSDLVETGATNAKVVTTNPFEVILLQAKIGIIVGIALAIPVLLYLSRDALRERGVLPDTPISKWKVAGFALGTLTLFTLGIAYAYTLFLPIMFEFLANTAESAGFRPTYQITKWVEFTALLSLSFGIAAQLPLVMSTLAYAEIVPYETFRDKWKYAIVGLYAGGALFTPPDPITQLMWATPLVVLYAISLQFTKLVVTLKRSNERLAFGQIAREHWNVVAGCGVIAFLAVYAFFTAGGIPLTNDVLAALPGSFWPTLPPLGSAVGTSDQVAAAAVGLFAGLAAAAVVLYWYVSRELDDMGGMRYEPASAGDPEDIDIGELTAGGVRAAPIEAFEDMTEDEALSLASDAIDDNDSEKAEAILDRFDEVEEQREQDAEQEDDPGPPGTGGPPPAPDAGENSEVPPHARDQGQAGPAPDPADDVPHTPADAAETERPPEAGPSPDDDGGDPGVVTETTTGVVDAFTDDDTTEEDIGGYYYDLSFILESLTAKSFRIAAVFMATLALVFVALYRGGLKIIQEDFLTRLPAGMNPGDVNPVALHPVEHLIFMIKFSLLVAIVVTAPLVLYYAWPALKERAGVTGDRRILGLWGGTLVGAVLVGSALGYAYVAPGVISWLAQDTIGANMVIAYRIKYYGWLIVYTTVGIGLLAEIPVTLFLFYYGGLLSFEAMWSRWREVVITVFALAALISPKGVFTMFVLAIPIALSFLGGLAALWLLTLGGRREKASETEPAD